MNELYGEYRPDLPVFGGALRQRTLDEGFRLPVHRPFKTPDRSQSWSFFHPNRPDVRYGPAWFRSQLHAIDPNLDVTWHPIHERWLVWARNPQVTHQTSPGWMLLFPVQSTTGRYLPLDERTIAKVYDRSPKKWGNAKAYFDRIEQEILRDRRKAEEARKTDVAAAAGEFWDYAAIKNIGTGSKFCHHHSGN